VIWKALFSLLGVGSFVYILHGYGFAHLAEDLVHLGWWSIPLALSFLPTVMCYALAWLLITPEFTYKHLGKLFRLMLISISWNNLSPFVKVLGEPVRVRLMSRWIDKKSSARSMVLYNIVHTLGTLISFFLASLLMILLYPVSPFLHGALAAFLVISPLLTFGLYLLPHLVKRFFGRSAHRNRLVIAGFWVRWGFSKIRIFSRRFPARFWGAVFLEIAARFVEGVTFWIAFRAIGQSASVMACGLIDVGRAIVDNLFFFIPYQVGSREGGIVMLAEHALGLTGAAAVSAAVFYRLVEIFWTGVGYLFWIQDENAFKSST